MLTRTPWNLFSPLRSKNPRYAKHFIKTGEHVRVTYENGNNRGLGVEPGHRKGQAEHLNNWATQLFYFSYIVSICIPINHILLLAQIPFKLRFAPLSIFSAVTKHIKRIYVVSSQCHCARNYFFIDVTYLFLYLFFGRESVALHMQHTNALKHIWYETLPKKLLQTTGSVISHGLDESRGREV